MSVTYFEFVDKGAILNLHNLYKSQETLLRRTLRLFVLTGIKHNLDNQISRYPRVQAKWIKP